MTIVLCWAIIKKLWTLNPIHIPTYQYFWFVTENNYLTEFSIFYNTLMHDVDHVLVQTVLEEQFYTDLSCFVLLNKWIFLCTNFHIIFVFKPQQLYLKWIWKLQPSGSVYKLGWDSLCFTNHHLVYGKVLMITKL